MSGCIATHELADTGAACARPNVRSGTNSAAKSEETKPERLRKLRRCGRDRLFESAFLQQRVVLRVVGTAAFAHTGEERWNL